MKRYAFLLFFLISTSVTYSQKDIYNASLITNALSDTVTLSFPILFNPPHEIDSNLWIESINNAIEFAKKLQLKKDEVLIHIINGNHYYIKGNFRQSQLQFSEALELAKRDNFLWEEAICLKGLAHINWRSGKNILSIESILKSIDILKSLNDTTEIISSSNILAGVYLSLNKINEADSIYSLMLTYAIDTKDSASIAQNYEYKGVIEFFRGNYKKAILNYSNSLHINSALNLDIQRGLNNANIAEAKYNLGLINEAIDHYFIAERYLLKHQFKSGLIFINYGLGMAYTKQGNYDKGIEKYNESLRLVEFTGEFREKPYIFITI